MCFCSPHPQAVAAPWDGIEIADQEIVSGSSQNFSYITASSFEVAYLSSPIFVSRGHERGYVLCVSAGIHGDELNGMEIAKRVFSYTEHQRGRCPVLVQKHD